MLQVNNIREQKEAYIKALKKRNFKAEEIFSEVLALDEQRRATQTKLDETLAESNRLSKEIGLLFKTGEHLRAGALKEETAQLKVTSKELSEQLNELVEELDKRLYNIPNIPHPSVPAGTS